MTDRATRILASLAFATSLIALTLAGWAAMTVSRQEAAVRDLTESFRERLMPEGGGVESLPMHSPPPELELEP